MDKCQHNQKITHFCIYQYCSSKQAAGCQNCIKKYHSHVGVADYIKTQEVDLLAQKFNVENSVKPKCRQFQQYVFAFFTLAKTQIFQTIEIVCKAMVNKIGYPFLSNLNHLSSYKRIKSKQYKKLGAKELKKFHNDCKGLQMSNVTSKERQLYIDQIIQNFNTIQALERIMKQYQNLVKKICKNFKHDSSPFRKIQDLRKYLNSVLKIDKRCQKQSYRCSFDPRLAKTILQSIPSDETNLIKQRASPILQKQKQKILQLQITNLLGQPQQKQNQKNKKNTQRTSINKYKHLRNLSVQRQNKVNESNKYQIKVNGQQRNNSYQSKQRQIIQRKQKLMKMMNLKEKSIGKKSPQKKQKSTQSTIKAPPLLKFQKNQLLNQRQKKEERPQVYRLSGLSQLSTDIFLKISTPQKQDLSSKILQTTPKTYIKQSRSVKQFNDDDQTTPQNQQTRNEQSQIDQKYKYGMVRLPSSQSNSSDADTFFKSYLSNLNKDSGKKRSLETSELNEIQTKRKSDKMSDSSPVKFQFNSTKHEQIVSDEQKSVGLYFMALQLSNPEQKIKYLKASLSYSPRNISAAQYLSSVYLNQNKAKQCLDLCTQYLSTLIKLGKPQLKKTFLINKSASLNSLGRYSQSITLLQAQVIYIQDSKLYKNLGDAYFFVGINQKCQYNYQKAIKLNPKLDQAMYNLAVCMYSQRNYFNAEVWITKALQINNNNNEYLVLKQQITKKLIKVHQENQSMN